MKEKYLNEPYEEAMGYKASNLITLFDHFANSRKPYDRLWKVLDAYDKGEFWTIVGKDLPTYSIKPETNWLNYVKNNYMNSIYSGSYRGFAFPRKYNFQKETTAINEFIDYIFDKLDIPFQQFRAGERAALLNFGVLEFGWNSDIIDGAETMFHGDLECRWVDNISTYLDPSVRDYLKGRAIFLSEEVSLTELANEKRFAPRVLHYKSLFKDDMDSMPETEVDRYYGSRSREGKDQTVRLLTCYYKHTDRQTGSYRVDKVWLINDGFILDTQLGLQPAEFPIRVLYSGLPTNDPYGTPIGKLILYNSMSINILDAIESTMVYSALKRAKVVSRRAGINEELFAKEGNFPDRLWVVDGDPNNLVRYIDLPDLPADRHLLKQRLEYGIMRVSGVDDAYTGRDTGSVQTTGGMDILNQRLTMSDNGRVVALQNFIKSVTQLILSFYMVHGDKRTFPKHNSKLETTDIQEIDFELLRKENLKFDFTCSVTPNLPKNLMRLGQVANELMEKQMQYNSQPPLITPEEWLNWQDFPQKYHILKRMSDDRMRNDREEIQAEIVNYAGLVQQGVRPEAAVDMLAQERQMKREQPGLGNTGNSGLPQQQQQG